MIFFYTISYSIEEYYIFVITVEALCTKVWLWIGFITCALYFPKSMEYDKYRMRGSMYYVVKKRAGLKISQDRNRQGMLLEMNSVIRQSEINEQETEKPEDLQ